MTEVVRDEKLEERLNTALIQWNRNRPRNNQRTLGPSSLGGCREYIRATIAGDEGLPDNREEGLDEALVGTMLGEDLEAIFAEALGARVQVPVSMYFENLDLHVAGSSDVLFIAENELVDLKSTDDMASVLREGPPLKYFIQVAVYTVAAVQRGYLKEGATAYLAYYDRRGKFRKFVCIPAPWDAIQSFIALAEQRLREVFDVLEAGSPEESRWSLRDQSPSLCFATQCPFRLNCWGGAEEWVPSGQISGSDELAAVAEYVEAREAMKDAEIRKQNARDRLAGISGVTSDKKWAVSWKEGRNSSRLDVIRL